ncbi:MAG: DUF4411 family protein [Thermomicrobiales bacterium]
MGAGGNGYSIDSSSLIRCRHIYPIDVFPSLWQALDDLLARNVLFPHEEVWNEIHRGTDPLTAWAASRKTGLCVAADAGQVRAVQQIAARFPLANYTTTTEHRADPWVVSLAITRTLCVVSEEVGTAQTFPKVPQMCAALGVPHMHILDVMRAEGWTF